MTDLARHVADHNQSLLDWLRAVLPGSDIAWGPVGEAADGSEGAGLRIALDDVRPVPDKRTDRALPLRMDLTYVLTPAGEPETVATALVGIADAVRSESAYELTDPPPDSWWLAAGLPRRPAARLSSRLVIEPEPEPTAPPVRERRVLVTHPGLVTGTVTRAGVPLAGAEIGKAGSVERVRTDRAGRFALTGVDGTRPLPIVVAAGRSRFTATIPAGAEDPQIVCPEPTDQGD